MKKKIKSLSILSIVITSTLCSLPCIQNEALTFRKVQASIWSDPTEQTPFAFETNQTNQTNVKTKKEHFKLKRSQLDSDVYIPIHRQIGVQHLDPISIEVDSQVGVGMNTPQKFIIEVEKEHNTNTTSKLEETKTNNPSEFAELNTSNPNELELHKTNTTSKLKESITNTSIIRTNLQRLVDEINENYPNIKIEKEFQTVFYGLSISMEQPQTNLAILEKIKRMPGVKSIHPTTIYTAKLDESVPFIGGDAIRHYFDNNQQHLTGKGIKVGVIDTGIDYNHPDLQKNYQGGFDLVDDDHDPMETVKAQGETTLHGTHVAGIIAANGRVKGVAPEAEIYAYRALGPGGIGTSDQVIAAIEKAVDDGMDIINLSLGSAVNGPDYPTSIALDRAVEKGVIAVTSNGNSGPNLWTVGSPGTSQKAISVGASTPPIKIPYITLNSIPEKVISMQSLHGAAQWNLTKDYEIIDGGLGTIDDLTEVEAEGKAEVKGKIILMERGKIPFSEKVKNASQKGAKAVLIFNNEKGSFTGALQEKIEIPAGSISREDGVFIKQELKKGKKYLDTKTRKIQDQIADFSSRGPVTHSWTIKPDVVAPGVEIDSTIPDGYLALRGTSMASPHVAGAAALIKQAHPDWTPMQVKAALMNTAKPLQAENGNPYIPSEQGAGRIQVDKAIAAAVLAYPGSLAFGAIDSIDSKERTSTNFVKKSIEITLENKSTETEKVTFRQPRHKKGLRWTMPLSFYIAPNEKKTVAIAIEVVPTEATNGLHFGTITVDTSTSSISLPYLYVIGDPNHPRVSGFSFEEDDVENSIYKCELYLPEGAEELGVALFEPATLKYVGLLIQRNNVDRGVFEQLLTREEIPYQDGVYHVVVYAVQGGIESIQHSQLELNSK